MDVNQKMQAMVFREIGKPLSLETVPAPVPAENQLRVKVDACGLCRTDLHIIDGELTQPTLPLIPGLQVVGTIDKIGKLVDGFTIAQRVGVPWLGGSCQKCRYCLDGNENLCDHAQYTGYNINGGFAEYTIADPRYCFPIPEGYSNLQAAPLLCAGLIGYRAYRLVQSSKTIGLYGFGAAAHILIQLAMYQKKSIYAFTRPGDTNAQSFATSLGASWVGDANQAPPHQLDSAIIFAPVGDLVPISLKAVRKGGTVVCAGIHMSEIPAFPYSLLWEERTLTSVANLTRQDGLEFFELAPQVPIKTEVTTYNLSQANKALQDLKTGKLTGAAVISLG